MDMSFAHQPEIGWSWDDNPNRNHHLYCRLLWCSIHCQAAWSPAAPQRVAIHPVMIGCLFHHVFNPKHIAEGLWDRSWNWRIQPSNIQFLQVYVDLNKSILCLQTPTLPSFYQYQQKNSKTILQEKDSVSASLFCIEEVIPWSSLWCSAVNATNQGSVFWH